MKDQSKTEIKVGVMVVAGTLVFLWILGWAKNFSFSANEKYLDIKFPTVAGLEIGDPVTVNGVRKGSVEDFKVESEDVIVKVKLDSDVDLRKDATFAVSMLDLMGGKKINIWPGEAPEEINYNKTQKGQFHADIPYVMTMLGKMQGDLSESIKELKVTLSSLNKYLNNQKLNENINASVANLKDLTEKLNMLIEENHNDFRRITSNTVQITDVAKELLHNNKELIDSAVTDISGLLRTSDSLITKFNNFAEETALRKNNLGKIMYDEDLYNNLTGTLRDLKALTKMIIEQLKGEGLNVDAHIDFN